MSVCSLRAKKRPANKEHGGPHFEKSHVGVPLGIGQNGDRPGLSFFHHQRDVLKILGMGMSAPLSLCPGSLRYYRDGPRHRTSNGQDKVQQERNTARHDRGPMRGTQGKAPAHSEQPCSAKIAPRDIRLDTPQRHTEPVTEQRQETSDARNPPLPAANGYSWLVVWQSSKSQAGCSFPRLFKPRADFARTPFRTVINWKGSAKRGERELWREARSGML